MRLLILSIIAVVFAQDSKHVSQEVAKREARKFAKLSLDNLVSELAQAREKLEFLEYEHKIMSEDDWENQFRDEYNHTGDSILIGHTVCRWFHENNKACSMRPHDEVFGKLSDMELGQNWYQTMGDMVLALRSQTRLL